jgi:signal transduction histidine kinase
MNRFHASARVALAVSLLTLLLLSAGAASAGYLVEAHNEQSDRARQFAVARSYVEHTASAVKPGLTEIGTKRRLHILAERLATTRLGVQLTLTSQASKRAIYLSAGLGRTVRLSTGRTAAVQPTASYLFPLADGSGRALALDLYAPSLDRTRAVLVGLASGLVVIFVGGTLLMWAASRWLVAPLRRLNTQVDAIAGGDPIETPGTSPIREVENVAQAIAGMGARLARTAEQEAQLESERRMLVSSIAHDLRTPLFSLRGYLDAIATGIGDPGERLEQARNKAEQLDRLVTGLFDYSRAGFDTRPTLQTIVLADAVTDATSAFELAADQRGVKLRVTAHTRDEVRIHRDGFERALANIIDNALRHTPQGGTVEITCGEDTDNAFVRVVDDGPGIPADLLPSVFEPMTRAQSAPNRSADGAGLGLTIAARLLRNQGGTIDAANAPRRGAILTLRLPRMVTEPSARDTQL